MFATDVETQQKLADEDHKSVRRNLSRNRHLALPVAKRLLECDDVSVRQKVIEGIADLDTVRQMLENPDDSAFRHAIYNPLVIEHADEFVEHPHEDERTHLAFHIDQLSDAMFGKLVQYTDWRTQEYLAKAKKMTRERVEKLLDVGRSDAIWQLSARGKLKEADVLRCANHDDPAVREVIASNHAMSDDVFERLLKDTDNIRNALAYNKELTKVQKARIKAEA